MNELKKKITYSNETEKEVKTKIYYMKINKN